MNAQDFSAPVLRLRLALSNLGPVAACAGVLLLAGALALAWLLPERALQVQRRAVALRLAALPPVAASMATPSPNANLALFYDTLGERRYAEQQVKTLFALAAKSGLALSQGEYKSGVESNGRFQTYQVNLPVKGSYAAIWQFAMLALRAIPFASLDEISFRRDTIGEPAVDARLRLTLYLADPLAGAPR
ncbi:MAG: hypothetical protein JWM36_4810 [Hyphomicrobiales bacterium]|nr:hypothetical protein [Hyphomicrobiales bacterium]